MSLWYIESKHVSMQAYWHSHMSCPHNKLGTIHTAEQKVTANREQYTERYICGYPKQLRAPWNGIATKNTACPMIVPHQAQKYGLGVPITTGSLRSPNSTYSQPYVDDHARHTALYKAIAPDAGSCNSPASRPHILLLPSADATYMRYQHRIQWFALSNCSTQAGC